MYPSERREIPEFLKGYLIFGDCLKQLIASIDLHQTCLNKIKHELENYQGPNGRCYETSLGDVGNTIDARSMKSTTSVSFNGTEDNTAAAKSPMPITFGKYIFHALNSYKIYIIIKCWDKCLVLRRLPDFKGFELKAEYENIQCYKIAHGQIKYCPIVEFKFYNNEIIKTDFEDDINEKTAEMDFDSRSEFKQLLERVRIAKTELQLHKSITAHSFQRLQNQLTHGLPHLRSNKLEEKQMLSRCGDIWKRFTPKNDLVIGIPLVNQCGSPNLTIIRNLKPLLQPDHLPENSIQYQFRLYQLKQKFDQLDSLETFLQTEDQQLQANIWTQDENLKILPETFIILLIKLKMSQIISLKQCPLILTYEVLKDFHGTSDAKVTPLTMPLQLFLQTLDFHKILHEERSRYELKFQQQTLHQDFLTIAMISHETNLKIVFKSYKDLEIFEQLLQEKFDFENTHTTNDGHGGNNIHQRSIFYNKKPYSLWFGCLLLCLLDEEPGDDLDQCLTTWTIYCQTVDSTLLLIKILLNDILTLQCNVLSIEDYTKKPKTCMEEFENTLRQELLYLQMMLKNKSKENNSQESSKLYTSLCKLQIKSDEIITKDLMEKLNI